MNRKEKERKKWKARNENKLSLIFMILALSSFKVSSLGN